MKNFSKNVFSSTRLHTFCFFFSFETCAAWKPIAPNRKQTKGKNFTLGFPRSIAAQKSLLSGWVSISLKQVSLSTSWDQLKFTL